MELATAVTETTDDQGRVTLRLTPTSAGQVTITATADGETVNAQLVVSTGTYSLTASPATLTLGVATEVTFTLNVGNMPLGNTAVRLWGEKLTFSSTEATTDNDGKFTVKLTPTGSTATRTITCTVGTDTASVDLSVTGVAFVLSASGGDKPFIDDKYQTITLTASLEIDGKMVPLDGTPVTWTVESSTVSCAAWNRSAGAYNGLTWGEIPLSLKQTAADKTDGPSGTAPNGAEASLTDIVGERTVKVTAQVTYNGQLYTAEEKTVTFGDGPLSVFAGPPLTSYMNWYDAASTCGGTPGDPSKKNQYQRTTNLPEIAQLQAVSRGIATHAYGAVYAAGWPLENYWSGQAGYDGTGAWGVQLRLGSGSETLAENPTFFAVCLPGG